MDLEPKKTGAASAIPAPFQHQHHQIIYAYSNTVTTKRYQKQFSPINGS
jgi:hypothetical protein